jgi:hypothetical protein
VLCEGMARLWSGGWTGRSDEASDPGDVACGCETKLIGLCGVSDREGRTCLIAKTLSRTLLEVIKPYLSDV